jgi:hypothetical protein
VSRREPQPGAALAAPILGGLLGGLPGRWSIGEHDRFVTQMT